MANPFGQKQPQDHLGAKSSKSIDTVLRESADLDLRRQSQIQRQIDSINRLLVNGDYDKEMVALQNQLVIADEKLRNVTAIAHELVGDENGDFEALGGRLFEALGMDL